MRRPHLMIIVAFAALVAISFAGGRGVTAPLASSTPGTPFDPIVATAEALEVPVDCVEDAFGTGAETLAAGVGATPEALPTEIEVLMFDLGFDPCAIFIPADTPVTLTFDNIDLAVGDFAIDELGVRSAEIDGGETGSVTFQAPPGVYAFYSTPPNQRMLGRAGIVVAVDDNGTPTAGTPVPAR